MKKFVRTFACAGLLGAALSGPAYGMGPMGVMGAMGLMGMMGAAMGGAGAMTETMGSGESRHREDAHRSDTHSAPAAPMDGDIDSRALPQEPDPMRSGNP
ncbi:MAG TPA: hypothetical protein VF501_10170 [Thiobacillus sp.]